MKTLPLSNSERVAVVSDEDFDAVKDFSWYLKKSRNSTYVATSVRDGHKVSTIRLHRYIAERAGILIEWNMNDHIHHINHDRYDCRRENLKAVDPILHAQETWRYRQEEADTILD